MHLVTTICIWLSPNAFLQCIQYSPYAYCDDVNYQMQTVLQIQQSANCIWLYMKYYQMHLVCKQCPNAYGYWLNHQMHLGFNVETRPECILLLAQSPNAFRYQRWTTPKCKWSNWTLWMHMGKVPVTNQMHLNFECIWGFWYLIPKCISMHLGIIVVNQMHSSSTH